MGRGRVWLAVVLSAAAVLLTTGAAPGPEPYAGPAQAVPVSAGLTARYAAVRQDIRTALATARRIGDGDRIAALQALLADGRQFLRFDARGSGRVVEVLGDLATAERIAVVVPGADGRIGNFDSAKWAGGEARALAAAEQQADPGARTAVVAWLGYAAPRTLSLGILTDDHAVSGARELQRLTDDLRTVNAAARIGLVCHSYGSVVCGKAASRTPASDIVLAGSPGTGADTVADLHTPAHVWAGRGTGDWVQLVPHARLLGIGFGADPVDRDFGATVFDAGSAGHSGYFTPGSTALRNIARIVLGRDAEVTRD